MICSKKGVPPRRDALFLYLVSASRRAFLMARRFWGLMEKLRRPRRSYWVALTALPTARPQIVTGMSAFFAASTTMAMSFFMAGLAGR